MVNYCWKILLWLPEKPQNSDYKISKKVSDIICEMISDEDLNIKNEGIILAGDYYAYAAIPLLEKEIANRKRPEDIWEEDYNVSHSFTIAEQAQRVLKILKK